MLIFDPGRGLMMLCCQPEVNYQPSQAIFKALWLLSGRIVHVLQILIKFCFLALDHRRYFQ